MTPEAVIDVLQRAFQVGGMVAAPVILMSLVAGVVVSVLQATTQINDATLVFVPKIIGVVAVLALFGPWMLQLYIDFTREMLLNLYLFGR
ncbi:MAG TPA: flagellar biosynthesis protein FliQ [Verrucomicrobiae bacterium]|jgi:flagellar biosynthesis protein FliQ|nr:flagellar biosynthesis protein FliQ [Verrucomicrobiae bacterium]